MFKKYHLWKNINKYLNLSPHKSEPMQLSKVLILFLMKKKTENKNYKKFICKCRGVTLTPFSDNCGIEYNVEDYIELLLL